MDYASGLIIGLMFALGVILAAVLIQTFFLWIAAKFLKFKEQTFVKALIVTVVQIVATTIIGVVLGLLSSMAGRISPILALIGFLLEFAISVLAQIYIIKNMYDENWSNSIVAFIISKIFIVIILVFLIVGVVLWQLGVFSTADYRGVVVKDWVKIQPLSASIMYTTPNQEFVSSFTNVAGTTITLTGATVKESSSGTTCSPVLINGMAITNDGVNVKPGYAFGISATCAGAGINTGDQYWMDITFEYTAVIGGISTEHTEEGTMSGNAE